jgi:hypothetical protein
MNIPGRRYFGGDEVYSDWFPRGGDSVLIRVQKVQSDSTTSDANVTVTLVTKNSEDPGNGDPVTFSSTPAALVVSGTATTTADDEVITLQVNSSTTEGLKELLRLKVTVDGTAAEWTAVRILPPIFFDIAS